MSCTPDNPGKEKTAIGSQTPVITTLSITLRRRSCRKRSRTDALAESDISDVDSEDGLDETLLDRLTALKDIVPPTYRKRIADASATGYRWSAKALSMGGSTLWIVSTSALLLGVPWALAFGEEQQVQEMEKEMRMQQSANEVSAGHPRAAME